MKTKIKNEEEFDKKELLMISLLCFMQSNNSVEQRILSSAEVITNIKCIDDEIAQFIKGIILMLCDKFVEDELLNIQISNLVGGNMKIVEDYAKRYAQEHAQEYAEKYVLESKKEFVINLDKKGFSLDDIAETANVSLDFVKETLSK